MIIDYFFHITYHRVRLRESNILSVKKLTRFKFVFTIFKLSIKFANIFQFQSGSKNSSCFTIKIFFKF